MKGYALCIRTTLPFLAPFMIRVIQGWYSPFDSAWNGSAKQRSPMISKVRYKYHADISFRPLSELPIDSFILVMSRFAYWIMIGSWSRRAPSENELTMIFLILAWSAWLETTRSEPDNYKHSTPRLYLGESGLFWYPECRTAGLSLFQASQVWCHRCLVVAIISSSPNTYWAQKKNIPLQARAVLKDKDFGPIRTTEPYLSWRLLAFSACSPLISSR